ncbi:MAG: acyltransferase domain-containing protein [Pseudomonadota bacterium]
MTSQYKNVFMFSGQGAQYFQMGRGLFEQGATFAREMRAMDEIVRALSGRSVLAALYGEGSKALPFDDIGLTHPAIFMVEYALARSVMEAGVEPDMTLGVSLGSVVAAVVSGCLPMEEALGWVVRHAAWIAQHCQVGGMIGVLGARQLYQDAALRDVSVVAAENGPSHWVLSARAAHLEGIETFLKARQVPFGRLPVHYPFHSPWMVKPSAPPPVPMPATCAARLPLVCCAHAGVLGQLPGDYFWQAAIEPIRFAQTIDALEQTGREGSHRYLDLGPSSTLATLLKYLLPKDAQGRVRGGLTPYGRDVANFEALAALGQRAAA